jgi:hypothetical protein
VSLFEAHTEIIRKGKASKPTEFGKMVKIQEAERQIVTHYEVYDERPSDSDLLVPALDVHEQQFGRPPRLGAADAGFFSAHNEAAAHAPGGQARLDITGKPLAKRKATLGKLLKVCRCRTSCWWGTSMAPASRSSTRPSCR